MSELFTTIGGIIVAIGIAWGGLVLFQPIDGSGLAIMSRALVMLPAWSLTGTGMVFLGIGGIMSRLDRIARNTFNGTVALERIVGATRGSAECPPSAPMAQIQG